ncbi:MAG TPA: LD-carboxypeptidase [Polyangiaceae bacterium]|jgi:muramoyltetrapeptide carboxypeptidase
MGRLTFPPPLAPGDTIAVVAPASPFPRDDFWRGLGWLRDRYRLVAPTAILGRHGFLAGDDASRARVLAAAMTAPGIKAIVAARGGYGAMRILEALPWEAFVASPRWIVGFSDITALHVEAASRGVATVHGPNVTGLGRADPPIRAAFLRALERPTAPVEWVGLQPLREGRAEGVLVGGNLALVEACAAARRWRPPPGAILVLEDVTERPYRLDRMLTSLRLGGHLANVAGIVLGEFAQCEPGPDGVLARDVLIERTCDLGIPVVSGAPFGHGARNDAFTLGARARIEGDRVRLG